MKHSLCFGGLLGGVVSVALTACGPGTGDTDAGNDAPTATDTQHVTETGVDAGTDVATMADTGGMMDTAAMTDTSTGTDTVTATDAVAMTDTAMPPSDAGSACNAVVLGSHAAVGMCITTAPPVATGGAITPGTYDLTALNLYATAPTCAAFSMTAPTGTLVVTATTINVASLQPPPATTIDHSTSTYVVSGINLTETQTCPTAQAPMAATYTATGSSIRLYGSLGGSTTIEEVLTLR